MDVERVVVRSSKQDTETILAVFYSYKDRPGIPIAHSELLAALGLEAKDIYYLKCVNRARQRFERETTIRLQSVWGVGYRVPTGKEQMKDGVSGLGRAYMAQERSHRVIAEIAPDRLNEEDRQKQLLLISKVRLLIELTRGETRPLLLEMQPFEPLPRMAITA